MKKKKIKYDVAKNGEEAVQKWRSGTFHLILVRATPAKLVVQQFAHQGLGCLDGYSDARDGRNSSHKGDQAFGEAEWAAVPLNASV